MIELNRDNFKIRESYITYYKTITLYDVLSLDFKKSSTGKYLTWEYPSGRYTKSEIRIVHRGRFAWHNVKNTLEKYLNYDNSLLRRVIIKRAFK